MFLHQSVYGEQNLYCANYPGHLHQDCRIECWKLEYMNTHIQVANCGCRNFELPPGDQVARMVFRWELTLVLVSAVCVSWVDVHRFLCASSMSVDCLWCHYDKEGSHLCGFVAALVQVFPSKPSTFCAHETGCVASALHALRCKVSWFDGVFPLLQRTKTPFAHFGLIQGKTHIRLFMLYPMLGECFEHKYWYLCTAQDSVFIIICRVVERHYSFL